MKQKKAWSFFQSLGKAFMYPIALLSVCGMMLGLGSGLASDDMAKLIPFLAIPIIKTILDFIVSLGLFAFVNLPVLFAIAIPLGLLKDKEDKAYGAFSGLIGFMAMHLGTNFYLKQHDLLVVADQMSTHGQTIILGIQSYNTSVLGGIVAGLLVASMYKKIVNLRIPESLGFYSGPRLVPIITLIVMTVGREESSPVTLNAHEDTAIADIPTPDKSELQAAEQMVKALGGKENIKSLDNCVTRLRLTIADMRLIDEVAIKRAGGIAVVKLDQNTLQVIIGTKVIALRRDMDNYMGIY